MILITGGLYQGKLEYAKSIANRDEQIIDSCEQLVRDQIEKGMKLDEILKDWLEIAETDKILIFNDVSMGIVPMEKSERIYREAAGKVGVMLADKADSVYRVFCGITMKIK